MRLMFVAAATAALLVSSAAHANKMYQWTDANGVVHFSDKAPPAKAVTKAPETVTVDYVDVPYNNQAEERWHGALREHGVAIRTITIKAQKPSHSKPTGR